MNEHEQIVKITNLMSSDFSINLVFDNLFKFSKNDIDEYVWISYHLQQILFINDLTEN